MLFIDLKIGFLFVLIIFIISKISPKESVKQLQVKLEKMNRGMKLIETVDGLGRLHEKRSNILYSQPLDIKSPEIKIEFINNEKQESESIYRRGLICISECFEGFTKHFFQN